MRFIIVSLAVLVIAGAGPVVAQEQDPETAGPSAAFEQGMARGVRAFNENNFAAAIKEFEQAKAAGPDKAEPLYYLGITLDKLNRHQEAEGALRQALALDPKSLRAHFALGTALYALEQYDQALREFARVERADLAAEVSDSMRATASYYQGLIHHKLEAYTRSTPQFMKAMALSPGVNRSARYYAGIGFFRQGLLEEAKEQFDEAIKANPADSEIAKSAQAFLAEIENARKPAKRWSLQTGLSVQSDTNVLALSDPSPLPSGISRREDLRTVLTLRGTYDPFRRDRWTGQVGYGFYQSLHRELSDFNVQHHTLGAQLLHKGRRVVSRLPYDFTYATLGRADYLVAHAVAPSALVVWSGAWATQLQIRYEDKDLRDGARFPSNSVRDGSNQMAALTNVLTFAKKKGHARLAYAYDRDATRNTDWTYTGHRFTAGTGLPLGRGFTAGLEADSYMKRFEYPNSASATGEKRNDDILTYTVSVNRNLAGPFDLNVQYGYTKNGSSLALFDYSRSVFTIAVTGSF